MDRTEHDAHIEWLVLRWKTGDMEAARRVVEHWHGPLMRYALRLTSSTDGARDVMQEAWLGICRGLSRLDDPARFRPWAYRIVYCRAADWIKRSQKRRRREVSDAVEGALDGPPHGTDGDPQGLWDGLAQLSGDQRQILRLFYVDGLKVREIGEVMQIPPGTVKSRLFHARIQLKKTMEREGIR